MVDGLYLQEVGLFGHGTGIGGEGLGHGVPPLAERSHWGLGIRDWGLSSGQCVLSDDLRQSLDAFANGLRAKVAEVQTYGVALAAVQGECQSRDIGPPALHGAREPAEWVQLSREE